MRYGETKVQWPDSGKLKLERLISHEYGLGDINHAFADLEQGHVARALIDMGRLHYPIGVGSNTVRRGACCYANGFWLAGVPRRPR